MHISGSRALVVDDARGEYGVLLDSEARTQALVLRAIAARGSRPLLADLAGGLLGLRKQVRFRTTRESAWALLSLDDYRANGVTSPIVTFSVRPLGPVAP